MKNPGSHEVKNDDMRTETTSEASINGQFKVKVTYNKQSNHLNYLRTGQSVVVSISVGAGLNIQGMIDAIAPDFYNNELFPEDLAPSALAELKQQLLLRNTFSASITRDMSFDFCFAKPDGDFPWAHYYSRETSVETIDISTKNIFGPVKISSDNSDDTVEQKAIPLLLFDITVGGGYTKVTTDPVAEFTESNTLMQFFILDTHKYHVGEVNKITGEPVEAEEANFIRKDEQKRAEEKRIQKNRERRALEQFFINYANEIETNLDVEDGTESRYQSETRPEGTICREFFEIEKSINNNENYLKQVLFIYQNERRASTDAVHIESLSRTINEINLALRKNPQCKSNDLKGDLEKYNFGKARAEFATAVTGFKNNTSTFEHTLSCFKNLIRIHYPQWLDRRSNSKGLKPRPLAAVDDTQAKLQEQILQARASVTGMMMQYGLA